MDSYSTNGQIAAVAASPGATALGLLGSSVNRAAIYYFMVSAVGTPVGDNILDWLVRRFTADGTRTARTPQALDPSSPAARLGAGQNYTVEPTYPATVRLFDFGAHQRATVQWNAAPGKEIRLAASGTAGLGFTPIHASYVGSAQATAQWTE